MLRSLLARLVVALARRLPQPPQPPEAPPMDRSTLYGRWRALPPVSPTARLFDLGPLRPPRVIPIDALHRYEYHARSEHTDDGADDLGGIAGLAWRLMVGD